MTINTKELTKKLLKEFAEEKRKYFDNEPKEYTGMQCYAMCNVFEVMLDDRKLNDILNVIFSKENKEVE